MKRLMAGMALLIGTAALSGCYDPGYSYVRSSGYQGDVYYGQGSSTVYDDGYYAPGYYAPGYYDPGYYGGYAPGVSVGISSVWYGGSRGRYHDRDDRHWRDHDHGWQRPPAGGQARYPRSGGGDHRGREVSERNDHWHGHRQDNGH